MSDFKITILERFEDWDSVKYRLTKFEKECPPDCYMNWHYQYAVWKSNYPGRRAWLVEVFGDSGLIGAAFLVEDASKKCGMNFKILRTMDFALMHMPPMMMKRGCGHEATAKFLDARAALQRASGADLVALYKMSPSACGPLLKELRSRKINSKLDVFNRSHEIVLHEGLEPYFKSKRRKSIYNIRRSRKLLSEAVGGDLEILRLRGEDYESEKFKKALKRFSMVRSCSWQHDEAVKRGGGYDLMISRFFEEVMKDWGKKGWLDLVLLQSDGRLLAGQVNVVFDQKQWIALMSFDKSLAAFSPGRVLFFMQIQDAYERGDRELILGGESETGKAFWANRLRETLKIEFFLPSIKGRLWCLRRRLGDFLDK